MNRSFANAHEGPDFEDGLVSFSLCDHDPAGGEASVARIVMRERDFRAMVEAFTGALSREDLRRSGGAPTAKGTRAPFGNPPPPPPRRAPMTGGGEALVLVDGD